MSQTNMQNIVEQAYKAQQERTHFSAFPENPKAYPEDAAANGLLAFQKMLNNNFTEIKENENATWIGEEVSPYMMTGLGIHYAAYSAEDLIITAKASAGSWQKLSAEQKATVLQDALQRVSNRFFEIAYATMHTTGQSFVMSFQASGPHANDRALEVVAMAHHELTRFPAQVNWVKNMGKFDLSLKKDFKTIAKGIGLVIGCSTFPTWNTVPGLFANLMAGNPSIVKPHPKSILPIAIVVAEIQKAFEAAGVDPNVCQLAPDTLNNPITKTLAENAEVKLIDYTGGSAFGDYIENLKGKTVFTEKAGVNSIIIDSCKDFDAVASNIAFSVCLYSGQMCTAPQNIFVPKNGILTDNGALTFEEVTEKICNAIKGLVENPKMGPFTLGAIQNDFTIQRVSEAASKNTVVLDSIAVQNPEFPDARIKSPVVMTCNAIETEKWVHECFGPAVFIVKTENSDESLCLAAKYAWEMGAITCTVHSTNETFVAQATTAMNNAYTPVSVNFTGAAFVNQHAAFSDLHVTGGNPSGNAGFTNPEYVNKRFVWVGNRYMG